MPAQRPRLTTPGPLLRGNGELHVVGTDEILTIVDPVGAMQRLLRLADGSRSRAEIAAALAIEFPLAAQDVEEALSELETAGVLEDGAPRSVRTVVRPASRRDVHARSLFGGQARAL